MNFTILNMSDGSNKGDLAILEGTVALTRRHFPKCKINLLNVDYDQKQIEESKWSRHLQTLDVNHYGSFFPGVYAKSRNPIAILVGIKNLVVSFWILGIAFILPRHALPLVPKRYQKAFRAIQSADIIILKGGSYLYSYGGLKQFLFLYRMLLSSIISIRLGKKVIALGHSIGPVQNGICRLLLRYCLSHFYQILVREDISLRYVTEKLRIDKGRIQVIPDLAFWCEESDDNQQESTDFRSVLEREGISSFSLDRPKVGLTVRMWHFPQQDNPTERFNNYIAAIVSIIKRLHKEYSATVFIMPHAQCDMELGEHIAEKVKEAEPIVLRSDYSTSTLRMIYSEMDLFIGTRIHSDIFALSTGTPAIAIAYQIPKGFGIISMVDGDNYILDIAELNEENLWQKIQDCFSKKKLIEKSIRKKVPILRQTIEDKYVEVMNDAVVEYTHGCSDCKKQW